MVQIENDRLYNIIQSMQKSGISIDAASMPARPGSESSSTGTSDGSHDRVVSTWAPACTEPVCCRLHVLALP